MESTPPTIQPASDAGDTHADTRPAPNTETLPGVHGDTNENIKPLALVGTPQYVQDMSMGILFNENIDNTKDMVAVIDAYIKNKLGVLDLDATVGNYRKLVEQAKSELNIDPDAGSLTQTSLLYYYLKGKMNL